MTHHKSSSAISRGVAQSLLLNTGQSGTGFAGMALSAPPLCRE